MPAATGHKHAPEGVNLVVPIELRRSEPGRIPPRLSTTRLLQSLQKLSDILRRTGPVRSTSCPSRAGRFLYPGRNRPLSSPGRTRSVPRYSLFYTIGHLAPFQNGGIGHLAPFCSGQGARMPIQTGCDFPGSSPRAPIGHLAPFVPGTIGHLALFGLHLSDTLRRSRGHTIGHLAPKLSDILRRLALAIGHLAPSYPQNYRTSCAELSDILRRLRCFSSSGTRRGIPLVVVFK